MDDAYDDIVDDFLAELTVIQVKLVYLVLRRSNKNIYLILFKSDNLI